MNKYNVQGQNIYLLKDDGGQEPGELIAIAVTPEQAINIAAALETLEEIINKKL